MLNLNLMMNHQFYTTFIILMRLEWKTSIGSSTLSASQPILVVISCREQAFCPLSSSHRFSQYVVFHCKTVAVNQSINHALCIEGIGIFWKNGCLNFSFSNYFYFWYNKLYLYCQRNHFWMIRFRCLQIFLLMVECFIHHLLDTQSLILMFKSIENFVSTQFINHNQAKTSTAGYWPFPRFAKQISPAPFAFIPI